MKYILFTVVGSADPIKNAADGGIVHIARCYNPEKIYLCYTKDFYLRASLTAFYLVELFGYNDCENQIELVEISNLGEGAFHRVGACNDFFKSEILSVDNAYNAKKYGEATLLLNLSSGMPSMQSDLYLLGSTLNLKNLSGITMLQPANPNFDSAFGELSEMGKIEASTIDNYLRNVTPETYEFTKKILPKALNRDENINRNPQSGRCIVAENKSVVKLRDINLIIRLVDRCEFQLATKLLQEPDFFDITKELRAAIVILSLLSQTLRHEARCAFERFSENDIKNSRILSELQAYSNADVEAVYDGIMRLSLMIESSENIQNCADIFRYFTPVLYTLEKGILKRTNISAYNQLFFGATNPSSFDLYSSCIKDGVVDSDNKRLLKNLRSIEVDYRNPAAHQLSPVLKDEKIRKTLNEIIESLIILYNNYYEIKIDADNNIFKRMKTQIIEKLAKL